MSPASTGSPPWSTAHRAQGRTVDTAHAYVTAATVREPLYVMATRGRESNRLYVDTAYDPDVATSHEDATPANPVEVLESIIKTSGADVSATTTRQAEHDAAQGLWRLTAEGAAVLDVSRQRRPIAERQAEQARLYRSRGHGPVGPRL